MRRPAKTVFVVEHLRDGRRWFDVKRGNSAGEVLHTFRKKNPAGLLCAIYRLELVHGEATTALARGALADGPPP